MSKIGLALASVLLFAAPAVADERLVDSTWEISGDGSWYDDKPKFRTSCVPSRTGYSICTQTGMVQPHDHVVELLEQILAELRKSAAN